MLPQSTMFLEHMKFPTVHRVPKRWNAPQYNCSEKVHICFNNPYATLAKNAYTNHIAPMVQNIHTFKLQAYQSLQCSHRLYSLRASILQDAHSHNTNTAHIFMQSIITPTVHNVLYVFMKHPQPQIIQQPTTLTNQVHNISTIHNVPTVHKVSKFHKIPANHNAIGMHTILLLMANNTMLYNTILIEKQKGVVTKLSHVSHHF